MFPSHSPQQAVIAQQLANGLADYAAGMARLLEGRWDPELYRVLSDHFDGMQQQAGALPRLSASWTELLISRVELLHALWSPTAPTRVDGRVIALYERHKVLVEEVRGKCDEYVRQPAAGLRARVPQSSARPRT